MPSPPTPHTPARRMLGQSGDAPRTPSKPAKPRIPSTQRRTQSNSPRSSPNAHAAAGPRPAPTRRHTTQTVPQPRPSRQLSGHTAHASKRGDSSSHKRTASSPASRPRGGPHVLIPVPIRAKDAESPSFIRAPPGQRVDFVFSPPKKRGLIGRLLDSVEWGDPRENKPYRYRKSSSKPSASRPFYKRLLP